MKPIDRGEVLGLADYETIRDHFRSRVIGAKKRRRVQLGPRATAVFENRDTILLQIQEMLRTERITRPAAILHEIDTYTENLPGDDQLSCTVMIEIADDDEREAFLKAAVGFENHLWLVLGGTDRIKAHGADRGLPEFDRTTAVHYLKFNLPKASADSLRASTGTTALIELESDHPAYPVRVKLAPETGLEICDDLRGL